MTILLLIVHVLACIVLIVSILLQAGKGGGLAGGAFGGMGGGSSAVFGGTGAATFLSKVTTYVAIVFGLTCIGLWYSSSRSGDMLPETAAERLLNEQGPMPLNKGPLPPAGVGVETSPAAGTTAAPAPVDSTQ